MLCQLSVVLAACLLVAAVASPLRAADLSSGADQGPGRLTLSEGGAFSLYRPSAVSAFGSAFASNSDFSVNIASGVGLLGMSQAYHVDADVGPNLLGGYTAGVAAAMGARPGESGTTYGLRIGTGWVGEGLTGFSPRWTDPHEAGDTAVRISITQSITPRLSFVGLAEAHHGVSLNTTLDPGGTPNQLVVGTGIDLRF